MNHIFALRKILSAKPCATRLLKNLLNSQSEGSALVETAFTVPILLLLLTGTASFSIGLYRLQQLSNATSTAAQQLGAVAGTINDPCATAVTTVTSALPGWTAANLTYTLTLTDTSGTAHTYGPTAGSSFSCTAGASYMGANEPVTVKVGYKYNWLPIYRFSQISGLTATQTALME
jgi:Flp pilus assembly protein TadG